MSTFGRIRKIQPNDASYQVPAGGLHYTGGPVVADVAFDPAGTGLTETELGAALKELVTQVATLTARVTEIEGPVNTVPPAITGTPELTEEQTCSTGTWVGMGDISYEYQWFRDGVAIAEADENTYTTVAADEDTDLTCQVTATDDDGSRSVITEAVTITDGT
jgi:hypothetical protein